MKKIILFFILLVTTAWLQAQVTSLTGSGTAGSPWLIGTADELRFLRNQVNQSTDGSNLSEYQAEGKYFELTANIDLSGENWVPIGILNQTYASFKGNFNGAGYTISNFSVGTSSSRSVRDFNGLFGVTQTGCVIRNLRVENAAVYSDGTAAGVLVGRPQESLITDVQILNCSINHIRTDAAITVGGVAGVIRNSVIINTNTNNVTILSEAKNNTANREQAVGGIVGRIAASTAAPGGRIINCSVNGGSVTCKATDVASSLLFVGGIVGNSFQNTGNPNNYVLNCYVNSSLTLNYFTPVTGDKQVGGIIGTINNNCEVSNCIADMSSITSSHASARRGRIVGHLVGSTNVTTSNNYASAINFTPAYDYSANIGAATKDGADLGMNNPATLLESYVNSNPTYTFPSTVYSDISVNLKRWEAVLSTNANISSLTNCENCEVKVDGGTLTVDEAKTVKSISVAPGAELTLDAALTTTNGITLRSDATGTATIKGNGTYTGTITAQQYLGTARNWYVSSPVSAATSPANNITRYYEYIETGDNDYAKDGNNVAINPGETSYWKYLTTGTSMTVGKGYIAQANAETTVSFTGTPNNGNITTNFNVSRTDDKGKGFNLVGNPYPSYLDWSMLQAANANLMSTAWFKTKKDTEHGGGYTFASVNVEDPEDIEIVSNHANTTITKYIPPMQAFWVRVKPSTASAAITFTNAMREHRLNSGNLMKAPKQSERKRLRLVLSNGQVSDETLIYFDSKATNSYNGYDSPKMMNNSAVTPDLYSKIDGERLVINGLNALTVNMEIPLGFSLNSAASLKLKATQISNFAEGTRIYLLDKTENTQTELLPETEYNFSTLTPTLNNESRFSLLFKAPGAITGINTPDSNPVTVYVNAQNEIVILATESSNYAVYNAVGQRIASGRITNNLPFSINCFKGVYVVKVNNQSSRVVVK